MLPLLKKEGIEVFDPFDYLCDGKHCKLTDGERILYVDPLHLSVHGGDYLADKAKARLDALLQTPP